MAKRVLLAAEFVRGGATLARLRPLAQALHVRGLNVALAVPTPAGEAFQTYEAPRWPVPPPTGFVAVSYADVLMHGGYATPDALRGLMTGWLNVLAGARPDLLVADFAPTAMLAARVTGLPMAAVGDGFSLPPPVAPMPNMRPWADIPADAPASVEGRVLAVVNARLAALGAGELHALCDLFTAVPGFLCAFPELDHYPVRDGGIWYGQVFEPVPGAEPLWPDGNGKRVFVALDTRHPALPRLVEVIERLGLPALIQADGLPERMTNAMQRRTIRASNGDDRGALLSGCDVVVCQSAEIAVSALLAGKPLLMLPVFVEQMMTLHRVARQGLGLGTPPDTDVPGLDAVLRRLVDDRACRLRAVNFGRRYDGYQPSDAIEAVADGIHDLLGG